MYDSDFADRTINSQDFLELAEKEVNGLVQLLNLESGVKILDVPCGSGRHSIALARRGFQVTGLDINEMLLEKASQNCAGLPSANFVQGSMLDLSTQKKQYDVVLNMFSSFGYFASDDENFAVLRELAQCLRRRGTLVLHNIDRDWLMKIYTPVSWRESDTEFCVEARKFDPQTNYNEVNEIRLDKPTGLAKRTYHRMRLYNSDEIKQIFAAAGLVDVHIFGGFDGRPFVRGETTHPIYVGRTPV